MDAQNPLTIHLGSTFTKAAAGMILDIEITTVKDVCTTIPENVSTASFDETFWMNAPSIPKTISGKKNARE